MTSVPDQEWRVEINLDDEAHGFGIGERLRAHSLDDEARKRLGGRVVVTRDGPRVFLYAGSEAEAREAEAVARELVANDDLSADITVTRWHPAAEEWEDACSQGPDPQTDNCYIRGGAFHFDEAHSRCLSNPDRIPDRDFAANDRSFRCCTDF